MQGFAKLSAQLQERAEALITEPNSDNLIKYALAIQKAPRKEVYMAKSDREDIALMREANQKAVEVMGQAENDTSKCPFPQTYLSPVQT